MDCILTKFLVLNYISSEINLIFSAEVIVIWKKKDLKNHKDNMK